MTKDTIGKILNQTCEAWGIPQSILLDSQFRGKDIVACRTFLCHMWTMAGYGTIEIAGWLRPCIALFGSPIQQEAARERGNVARNRLYYRLQQMKEARD
jgi:hypothetical protein